ncbi:MAG: acyltransferase family protein [Eudoraea sp.]
MRRHDLDWLRVLVFGLLIFYHVGMFFVPWSFHIKNNITYDWLQYPMSFLNQWRLPILFVISGMGTFYALQKRNATQFASERIIRLLIPLIFGMLFIIPPQVYIERLAKNQFIGGYFDFWPSEALNGVYPEGNLSWHHLWFLPYLLIFSLVLIPLFFYLKRHPQNNLTQWLSKRTIKPLDLYIFIIPLYFIESFIEPFFPVTHALIGDWFTIVNYLFLFFYGFILISIKDRFWPLVEKHRRWFLIAGIICFSLRLLLRESFEDTTLRHFTEAFFKVANLWSWVLVCFGYAAKYLNRPSKILNYSNEAVYPFYILHQSVMLVLAFFIMDWEMSFGGKFSILVVGTFFISWLMYELFIRRWSIIRPFFGLKKKPKD